jgi:glycosyltransferase involved in cell wall biosynthesis
MNNPILSICIPTYNRADYLRDALESICLQLDQKLSESVEVVVADNASSDHTKQVVEDFIGKINKLVYVRNPENVGFDGNVDIVVRAAHGHYCWYLGDDDAIINGALSYMIELCHKDEYTVISVADKPLLTRPIITDEIEDYSDVNHISGLSPTDHYIQGHLPSALSMLIFRRLDWLQEASLKEHTPGWFYFETILKMAIIPGAQILHIKKPMILTGQDMRWADGGAGLQIFIDCNKFLRKMIDWGYDQKIITEELNSNAKKFPYVLLQAKGKGLSISRKNFSIIQNFTWTTPLLTKIISSFIFFIPNPIVRLMRDVKKKLV